MKERLTVYKNREKISGEYLMVSYKTKEYDLLEKYHKLFVTEEEAIIILKWFATSYKVKLKINFRNCRRPWGGYRNGRPFVTIPHSRKTIGVLIHEFAHAYGGGYNHDDDYIRTLDKYLRKFNKSKAKGIITIKEKLPDLSILKKLPDLSILNKCVKTN